MADNQAQKLILIQQKQIVHRYLLIPFFYFILLLSFSQGIEVILFGKIFVLLFLYFELGQLKSIEINFKEKTATFNYCKLDPFKISKTVSIENFNFVYASAYSKGWGWVIHLSNQKGKHLRLISRNDFSGQRPKSLEPMQICNELARGLSIKNGGGL